MHWASDSTLLAGTIDHQLKVFDVEKQAVQQSIFTGHKTSTCMDVNFANQNEYVLCGQEDGVVRLYDLKQAQSKQSKVFECHQRGVTSVKFNSRAENVFITGGLDGKVKMWDLRNE